MTNSSFARQWLGAAIANASHTPPRVTLRRQGWGQLEYGTSIAGTTPSTDQWAAYQFHRPDLGQGCVVAFRRPGCHYSAAEFPLRGVDPDAAYELEDADTGRRWRQTGADLMDRGLAITIDEQRGSSLVFCQATAPSLEAI
jgi:hypothetical protein